MRNFEVVMLFDDKNKIETLFNLKRLVYFLGKIE